MQPLDFKVFSVLMDEVHHKAFHQSIASLSYSKARLLSLLIFDSTGESLSYKSLTNYALAVIEAKPDRINPTLFTLGILTNYLLCKSEHTGDSRVGLKACANWYDYRLQVLKKFESDSAKTV